MTTNLMRCDEAECAVIQNASSEMTGEDDI